MRRLAIATTACAALAAAIAAPLSAQDSRDVLDEHNQAYNTGDFEAFMGTFAEDAVVVVEGYEFRGRDAIAASYAPNFGPGAPRARIERMGRASGGGIVQRESYVYADGTEVCCTVTAIWVEGGEITRVLVDTGGLGG
ncbi:nuclear transport factor 2 family protein [Aurantiacibacter sp. MUD11]|uniref:SgcJ/EcaC family oxidoreductase n=1 Tax=Aurantiacibacter sp. MUD11 TaxID=3003265 RepID=UPI0022AA622C|nr:nuclear transport factor 2 family protein [Aurantiacibacter sp. MUD11]WAT18725.1 nuclear transport factor 2 family protein [Aurantiacibacter sp. MUD11]